MATSHLERGHVQFCSNEGCQAKEKVMLCVFNMNVFAYICLSSVTFFPHYLSLLGSLLRRQPHWFPGVKSSETRKVPSYITPTVSMVPVKITYFDTNIRSENKYKAAFLYYVKMRKCLIVLNGIRCFSDKINSWFTVKTRVK